MDRSSLEEIFRISAPAFTVSPLLTYTSLTVPLISAVGYRTDEAHSQRGSYGLGLSIAANIAAMHHGKIWVESKGGRNTFILELPVKSGAGRSL